MITSKANSPNTSWIGRARRLFYIPGDTLLNATIALGYLVALAALANMAVGFITNPRDANVYSIPQRIVVDRTTDHDGTDKITISTVLRKNMDCAVEGGDGPPRVRFFASDGRSDVSPLFRPDGTISTGKTRGNAGDRIMVQGYWATVPPTMKDAHHFIVEVPCQLGKEKDYKRVIARWGPAPMPNQNTVIWNGLEPQDLLLGRNFPMYSDRMFGRG